MIETVNLHQSYGKTPIIKDCDLTLPEGQLIALIGPNGAGKSTLLSLLSRVLNERTGAIYLDGRELKQWPGKELARKLAYLQQSNQYGVHLTVEELVAFAVILITADAKPLQMNRSLLQQSTKWDWQISKSGRSMRYPADNCSGSTWQWF